MVGSGLPVVVLRPTLMFGWFDRKHLGWLARFMQKAPLFPIPGSGRYLRQPLYAGDFCDIIMACIEQRPAGKAYNISGQEKIDYIDLIRAVKEACGARAPIVRIPYSAVLGAALRLRPVRPRSAVHHHAARGAGDAGRVRGDRLARHLRREGDAAEGRARRDLSRIRPIRRSCWSSDEPRRRHRRRRDGARGRLSRAQARPSGDGARGRARSRRHGGAFRSRRPVDRALLPFRLQGGPADLRADGRARHRRQDALGADLDGLLRRRQALSLGRSGLAADVSRSSR